VIGVGARALGASDMAPGPGVSGGGRGSATPGPESRAALEIENMLAWVGADPLYEHALEGPLASRRSHDPGDRPAEIETTFVSRSANFRPRPALGP